MTYDKNTDYQALINDAVAKGDYFTAAQHEQARNKKIADLDASGTNLYGAKPTNNYTSWLDGFNGSATGVTGYTSKQDAAIAEMNENSKLWHTAETPEEKDALHARNQYLAGLNLGDGVVFDPVTGYWSGKADTSAYEIVQDGVDNMPQYDGSVVGERPTLDLSSIGQRPTLDLSSIGERPTFDSSGIGERPTFNDPYDTSIDEMLNQILNREDFSYDLESDPLYQQYRKQYLREGNRSLNDTLAAAASGAGGMNSYAVGAAAQANNYHLAQLNDRIPELYQLAYDMYMNDYNMDVTNLGLLQDRSDVAYNRHRDDVSDWEWDYAQGWNQHLQDNANWESDRNYLTDVYQMDNANWESDRDYLTDVYQMDNANWESDRAFQMGLTENQQALQQWATEMGLNGYLTDVDMENSASDTAYDRAMDLLASGIMPTDSMLTEAGIDSGIAAAIMAQVNGTAGGSGSGGGSGNGGDGDPGNGNDDGYVSGNGDVSSVTDYSSAVDYMKNAGVSSNVYSGMMTEAEWRNFKSNPERFGTSRGENNYTSYADYVKDYVTYATGG